MKELIKLSDTEYIVVDDSEIEALDWCLDTTTNRIFQYYTQRGLKETDKKITHSTEPLRGITLMSMDEVLEMRLSTLERKTAEASEKLNKIYEELNSNNH